VDEDVDQVLRDHGAALADAVEAVLPAWVDRALRGLVDDDVIAATVPATVNDVVPRLRALLARDVDDQRENPLAILRDAVRHPTEALRAAGVPLPPSSAQDRFAADHFPGDDYGLTPMTWRDVDESLHEPGIIWGALKARASMARHRTT
jgi:hypothetical protein